MDKDVYERLGFAKCKELAMKSYSLWRLLELSKTRKSTQVRGVVHEGIAKDFIREFLPQEFETKSGLIFDAQSKRMSPQIDAIIYEGVPLLEFTDAVVVEKKQVKALFEIRSYIDHTSIFGTKKGDTRDPDTGLAAEFKRAKDFLPPEAKYILFAFELWSSSADDKIIARLKNICDAYGVVLRREVQRKGKLEIFNFDDSASRIIEWLRNLS